MGGRKGVWREKSLMLEQLLRLRTPPIAVKFLEVKEFPKGVIRPSNMGVGIAVCQAITAARYMFWTIGVGVEDVECVPSMILFGWARPEEEKIFIEFLRKVGHAKDEKASKEMFQKIPRLNEGEFSAILVAPLRRCSFDPDVIVVYGNPAQVGRLIYTRTYIGGGAMSLELVARAVSCAEALIRPFKSGDCTVSIPGVGDRVFAAVSDDELIFSIPINWLDEIIKGVKEAGRKIGLRYPMPKFLLYKPMFPAEYQFLRSKIKIIKRM